MNIPLTFLCLLTAWVISDTTCVPLHNAVSEDSGMLRAINGMMEKRAGHTAAKLKDGRVLVAGGMGENESGSSSAEVFDPRTGSFTATGPMSARRVGHSSTLLADGTVLITGGYNGDYLAATEIYDPKAGRFLPGPPMTMPRSNHSAVVLKDGRILITGGITTGWSFLASSEIYDPADRRFIAAGPMTTPRESHTATVMADGRVLITGGHKDRRANITIYSSTEIFDPKRSTFAAAADMTARRHKHDAVLLKDGKVLVIGGTDERDVGGLNITLEVFDPASGRFARAGELLAGRYKFGGTSILLNDGKVLILGGASSAEVFDPDDGGSEPVSGKFTSKRLVGAAVALDDGSVLFTGGYDEQIRVSHDAWVYRKKG